MDIIENRKKRWIEFQNVYSNQQFVFRINYSPDDLPRVLPYKDLWEKRIQWSLDKYQRDMERAIWLNDDNIPFLDMLTGTEIFPEAFGAKVHRFDNERPVSLPMIYSYKEVEKIKVPELSKSSLAILFDKADELKIRCGNPDAIIRIPDIQSSMDIAALLWDKSDFYTAFYLTPDAIKELSDKAYQLVTAFYDEWIKRYGNEFIAHYPVYYMKSGITLSEDEIGVVNQEQFEEFFLPELIKISERYDGIGIHCCADSQHQWDSFKKIPKLKMLNLCRPQEILNESFSTFSKTCPQFPYVTSDIPSQNWEFTTQFPGKAHIVLELNAKTKEEAMELAIKLQEITTI